MKQQFSLYTTSEYDDWFIEENPKAKLQIEKRLSHLKITRNSMIQSGNCAEKMEDECITL
jgi:hypothetical protein